MSAWDPVKGLAHMAASTALLYVSLSANVLGCD
jgi:hypothetical protein